MSDSNRLCVSNVSFVPPGGFACECPIIGGMISGGSLQELTDECANHLVKNGVAPPPDLFERVQDSICRRNSTWRYCKPCKKTTAKVSAMAVIRWVRAMSKFALKGFKLVPQEEAERRAEICAACPMQVKTPSLCWGCHGIAGLLPAISGARKTPHDSKLETCGVCGCYNSVSVHLPTDVSGGGSYPEWCWKN